jgi:hypothetical protein
MRASGGHAATSASAVSDRFGYIKYQPDTGLAAVTPTGSPDKPTWRSGAADSTCTHCPVYGRTHVVAEPHRAVAGLAPVDAGVKGGLVWRFVHPLL